MKKIYLSLLTIVLIGISLLLWSCGTKKEESKEKSQEEGKRAGYSGKKSLNYFSIEPQTLDAQLLWGSPEIVQTNMFLEGLLRPGKEEGKYMPGVAESWDHDKATNTYTFKLRNNAKWSDGTPVTAKDFFFAWRRALDAHATYSFLITDFVKGTAQYAKLSKKTFLEKKGMKNVDDKKIEAMNDAQLAEFNKQKDKLWSQVGIKEGEGTIEIQLIAPAPFFPGLAAFPVYFPMKEEFCKKHLEAKDYAVEVTGLISNGPWIAKEWAHKDYIKFERNEHYWNNEQINIDDIHLKYLTDVETRTNLLKTGKLDGSFIQAKDLPDFKDVGTLEQYNLHPLVDLPDFTVFFIEYNHFKNKVTKNANIRKAMAYAMDRKGFVENINLGDDPALALVPKVFPGLNKSFREENGQALLEDNNKEKAKEFLKKGLKELKLKKLPLQDMLIGESDIAKKIAEKFQSDWEEIGIKVNLIPLPWGERLTRMQQGKFSMVGGGWGPDYPDAMTYLDLFETSNGSNNGKYSNPAYDKLIHAAKAEVDPVKRMDYMYKAEKMVIDDMIIAPQYFRTSHWAFKKYITGVVHRGIGPRVDFYWADIDMEAKMAEQNK